MESVGAGLSHVVDNATHVTAIFSVEIRHHLQFRNGVLVAKKDRRTTDGVVIVILPVQLVVVRAGALAVDRQLRAIVVAESSAACGRNTRGEQHEGIVSIAERDIGDLLGVKGL